MSNVPSKGLAYQKELHRYFNAVQTKQADFWCNAPVLDRMQVARRKLMRLINLGWVLEVSAENTPCDKAGIDFTWKNERLDVWHAIDCTAMIKQGVPQLINVFLIELEYGGPSMECKTNFLELLVNLTEAAGLKLSLLPPPAMVVVKDLKKEIEAFQTRLYDLAKQTGNKLFTEWADYLHKAVGFQNVASSGRFHIGVELIDDAIAKAVTAFLDARKSGCPDFDGGSFQRGGRLSYSPNTDSLHVQDPANPIWPNMTNRIQACFDTQYARLIKIDCSAGPFLIVIKQIFCAQGIGWVINHVLDVIEAKYDGRSLQVAPKMKAPAPVPQAVITRKQPARNFVIITSEGNLVPATARLARQAGA